jgi:hypothetical protein
MNPFDGPPSSPPVSFDRPPEPPTEPFGAPTPAPESRRGRMVAAVFATAAILGAAAFGVSELASADDDSDLTDEAAADPADDVTPKSDESARAAEPTDTDSNGDDSNGDDSNGDDSNGDDTDNNGDADDPSGDAPDDRPLFHADGELRLDLGDGEPIIIDLGELDHEALAQFTECIGLPSFGVGDGFPRLDPEQFDQFFEDFDPEQFDQFFEELDPEQLPPELGPLFDSDQFGDLFDQFLEGFDPEQFDQFFEDFDPEQFDQFFDGMPPFGGQFGEHQAGRRALERRLGPDFSGGSWFPSGLDRDQIESCLAELD